MALDHDPHAGLDEPQLLDRTDALRVLRADTAEPVGALWDVIGAAGEPPRDHSSPTRTDRDRPALPRRARDPDRRQCRGELTARR